MGVPYTFANATTTQNLAYLDANFNYFANAITVQATTTAMTLDSSGNVGIGTSSPAAKLEVNGNITSGTAAYFYSYAGGTSVQVRSGIQCDGTNTRLIFVTAQAEVGRFDSSGNLLVGTTSASAKLGVSSVNQVTTQFTSDTSSQQCLTLRNNGSTSPRYLAYFQGSTGSGVGSITTDNTTTTYNTGSDYRLKHSVVPMTTGLATIGALNPVKYKWNLDDSDGEGFIAHELQTVIPLAVTGEKDAVDEEGNIKPQGVDYSKIVVHLVAAIQELTAEVTALKAKVGQ